MKKTSKNSSLKSSQVVLVAIIAMLVFTQQVYSNIPDSFSENIERTSQQETETADDEDSQLPTVLDIDQNLIASNIQLNVNHVFYEIMAIEQDEVEDHFGEAATLQSADDHYRILFRQVISPNAP